MNLTTEELSYLWELAQKSMPVPEPKHAEPEYATRAPYPIIRLEPLPAGDAVLPYIKHAIRSLEQVCLQSKCATCALYRSTSEACARNLLIQVERKLSKEEQE